MAAVVAAAADEAAAAAAAAAGWAGWTKSPARPASSRLFRKGTRVKAGDIVAKLDGAAYEDEEQAQKIRYLQAKSYVEQANSLLEVSQITLKEYRDGIYPQDLQLVRQYIQTCQLEKDRLERTLAWSQDMQKKGFRTSFQVNGDQLAYEQAKIALAEAKGMLDRLVKQTGPKIIKALEANVKAIKSDKLTQDASFSLEDQRLKRIKKNIEHCIVRAPGDGIVVYVNQTDRWGTSDRAHRRRRHAPAGSADLQLARPEAHARQGEGQRIEGDHDPHGSTCDGHGRRVSRSAAARHRGRGHRDQYAVQRLGCAGSTTPTSRSTRDLTTCVPGSVPRSRSMSIRARA